MVKLPAEVVARLRALYDGKRVCVTGGAGFIGGHLVDALLALGAQVSVIDDLSTGELDALAPHLEVSPDQLSFVNGSILDDAALRDALKGVSLVFHLAAVGSVPRSMENPARSWDVNATGTMRVLEESRRAKAKRVVFAASSSAYGDTPTLPKVEAMPTRPMSPYAASKVAAEALMASWCRAFGLDTVSLRYFNVFGQRQKADGPYAAVIPVFARRLLAGERPVIFGDGQQSRDFTFVANAVLATLLAGAHDGALAGEVINVGAGTRTTLIELAHELAEACLGDAGQSIAREPEHRAARPGDVMHSLADISKAQQTLGYRPVIGLKQGLAETIAWHREALKTSR